MTITLDPEAVARESVVADSADLARYLQDHLGQQLTAYLSGLRDPKVVGRWAAGRSQPRDAARLRLQHAFQAARMLVDAYGDRTAKAWFVGVNTRLDDEAPASVLRRAELPDDVRQVVAAARGFAGSSD